MASLEELGGIDENKLEKEVLNPIRHCLKYFELYEELNINCKKGILITGPTGSGKTALGIAIGKEVEKWGCYFKYIQGNNSILC
jgi:SpoVK/Ycf46/Vps4 family AAA+-type ATPase